MEGIVNNPLSGQEYIQYGKFTFKNITDELREVDAATVDMDKTVSIGINSGTDGTTFWNRFFSDFALSRSPVADVKKEVDAETETVINGFFDGTVSEEELSDAFQSLAEKFSSACKDAGYPIPLGWDKGITQTFTDTFYGEFRRKILDAAVQRNFQEGKQYITGDMNAQRNWKYYNSDYYFKSEAALSAITDGLNQIAQGPAYEGYTIPDYKAKGLNLYYNFNSAFSNQFCADEQFMKDPDMVPPKDFRWFYQSGGDSSRKVYSVDSLTVRNKDGEIVEYYDYRPTSFDPTDFRTATTWASYLDSKGNKHIVSTDFFYDCTKDDLRNVASLLKFTSGDSSQDAAVNRFLKNLQAYPAGYFSRFPQRQRGLSLRA